MQNLQERKVPCMNSYDRLQTYKNFTKKDIIVLLVKYGFYYLGNEDDVKCSWCNGIFTKWENIEKLLIKHKEQNSICAEKNIIYINELESGLQKIDIEDIKNENEKLKNLSICIICKTESRQLLFLPCRHVICCKICGDNTLFCYICNEMILGVVDIFLS